MPRYIVVWMKLLIALRLADIVWNSISSSSQTCMYDYMGFVVGKWHWDRFFSKYIFFSMSCSSASAHSSLIPSSYYWPWVAGLPITKKFRNSLWPVEISVKKLRWQAIEVTGLGTEVEEKGIGATGILMFVQLFVLQVNYTFDHLSSCSLNCWTLKIGSPSANTKCSSTEYIDLQTIRERTLVLFRWTVPILLHIH